MMLDNFSPEEAEIAYKELKQQYPTVLIELSGGMDEGNIVQYAKNADMISLGALTHSYKSIDVSMNVEITNAKTV